MNIYSKWDSGMHTYLLTSYVQSWHRICLYYLLSQRLVSLTWWMFTLSDLIFQGGCSPWHVCRLIAGSFCKVLTTFWLGGGTHWVCDFCMYLAASLINVIFTNAWMFSLSGRCDIFCLTDRLGFQISYM